MSEKLKPCPFCGSNSIQWTTDKRFNPLYRFIRCRMCNASMGDSTDTTDDGTEEALYQELVYRWNRRAEQ